MAHIKVVSSFYEQVMEQSPDKLGLGVDVSDAILGQALVHAVEECPQQAARHPHQDKESQVHSCPQVAVLITIWTLVSKEFCSRVKLRNHCSDILYEADKLTIIIIIMITIIK